MAAAALVLALDALLLAGAAIRGAPALQHSGVEPARTGTGAPGLGRSSQPVPWDEDRTMGRYPDQNPFHVPGET